MQNFDHNTTWADANRNRRFLGIELSPWALLALGAGLAVAVVQFVLVRPAMLQMSQLQSQVDSLETSIRGLAGQRGAVAGANTLLGQLVEQGRRNAEASQSLDHIAALHDRLNRQTEHVEQALVVMEKLATLQDNLLQNADRVERAGDTLGAMESLQARLTNQQYLTSDGHQALDQLDQLRHRLIDAQSNTASADASLDQIDTLHGRLILEHESNLAAQETLSALVGLKQATLDEAAEIEAARFALDGLVGLKDLTIAQTGNLDDATENLELLADVQNQLSKIALTFGRMRHWIVEILAFEPALNRAMRTLQPLTELTNLRRLNAAQLRQVVRAMDDGREPLLSEAAGAEPAPTSETAAPSPVAESALAN